MLEYQGWATISEASSEEDECDRRLVDVVSKIEKKIDIIRSEHYELGLKYFNAEPRLWVMGYSNRKRSDWDGIVGLFKYIAEISYGSYGVLSFWDDEDIDGLANMYQSYVLKRGGVKLKIDPFLSPCVKTLKDD